MAKNDYLSVTASMDPKPACVDGGSGWVLPRPADGLAPLSYTGNYDAWARQNRAVAKSHNRLELTLQGLNGHTVIIKKVGVQVVSRHPPVTGTAPELFAQCGGVEHSYYLANLDAPLSDVTAVGINGDGVEAVAPVVPLPHAVTESGPEQWYLIIDTKQCDCAFIPYFIYTSDGVTARFDIKLGDHPWEVSAIGTGSTHVYQQDNAGHWAKHP